MPYQWELHTTLPDVGRVSALGHEYVHNDGVSHLWFYHPTDGEGTILVITVERALKLLGLPHEQRRLNIRLERRMFHVPKERDNTELEKMPCPHCGRTVTKIDEDMMLHSIPWCLTWKMENR